MSGSRGFLGPFPELSKEERKALPLLAESGYFNSAHWDAAKRDDVDALRAVMTRDNIDTRNAIGAVMLHGATFYDSPAATRYLLGLGADPNVAERDLSMTPLHNSCARNASEEIMLLLLRAGADKTMRDKYGKTPLLMCNHAGARAKFESAMRAHREELRRAVDDGTDMRLPDVLLDLILEFVP